jgi:hypothetical protein
MKTRTYEPGDLTPEDRRKIEEAELAREVEDERRQRLVNNWRCPTCGNGPGWNHRGCLVAIVKAEG